MKNDRRAFYIYDLELAARKDGAKVLAFDEAFAVWEKMWRAGRTYGLNKGTATLLIGDIVRNDAEQYAVFLLRLSDTSAPNSVYSDPANGGYVEHEKEGTIGADFACHVLISTEMEKAQPNVYTCAIERVPGISAGLVQRTLSKFLNFEYNENAAFYVYPSPGGGLTKDNQPRTERCCPHVELRGRPSASMIKDINDGRLTGISLIRSEAVTPIAGAPFLRKSETELKLDIDYGNLPAQLWNSIEQAIKANAGDYGVAKVSYKRPGASRFVTVELNSNTGHPLSDLYVESFEVGPMFPPLAHSSKSVVARLSDPAVAQFKNHRAI
ncbi:hypothetical protein [Agrobacterium pusense]|uniref:hypothetical protein n=1 Tax=Agrobacterium pusense TaxID=648995 RepID=UPI001C6E5744|nr:hypothetical protein [Agrobacterium pusense]MBW9059176.1 hypothetical protein [Agrobacterium pusense]